MNDLKIVGIPGWSWKFRLLKYARRHKNLQEWLTVSLCYECSRHIELLLYFDKEKNNFTKTKYYKYQIKNKKSSGAALRKIEKFRRLYQKIKNGSGIDPPVITDDGCRLDGSHRCAILVHMGEELSLVNVVKYESVYPEDKSRKIRRSTKEYRASVYGL